MSVIVLGMYLMLAISVLAVFAEILVWIIRKVRRAMGLDADGRKVR